MSVKRKLTNSPGPPVWFRGPAVQNSHIGSELVFLRSLGCSPVLADQALDGLPALDPGSQIDRLAGLV
jgi:hypothetical protein